MDQVLKLMLKCVKRLSFDRMVGRTGAENYGWVPGHGALNAALMLDVVLGQARELRHDIFMLFLDLSTLGYSMPVIWWSRMECTIIEVRVDNFIREISQYNRTGSGTRRSSRSTTINTGHLERLQSQLRKNEYESQEWNA